MIKVAVSGAGGRMGREVVKMVLGDEELQLVAAIDPGAEGMDAGRLVGAEPCGVIVADDLASALLESGADVMVDFTVPQAAVQNTKIAIESGVRPVVGTTGFTRDEIDMLDKLAKERGIGGIIAPNFSIGAILMMKFAAQAAKYFPHVEIIEYHGDQKLDAPSGTAVKTANGSPRCVKNSGKGILMKKRRSRGPAADCMTVSAFTACACRGFLHSRRSSSALSDRR